VTIEIFDELDESGGLVSGNMLRLRALLHLLVHSPFVFSNCSSGICGEEEYIRRRKRGLKMSEQHFTRLVRIQKFMRTFKFNVRIWATTKTANREIYFTFSTW